MDVQSDKEFPLPMLFEVRLLPIDHSHGSGTPPQRAYSDGCRAVKSEIAQFIYLLIHNEKLCEVIDTIGKKAVLILGRFTPERKVVLDALREELRQRNYIPLLFDFEKPASRDLTETVVTLAHMARFVIADLTSPRSLPQELMSFVPDLPSVPVQPIISKDDSSWAMFERFQRYPWVLPIHQYERQEELIADLSDKIIQPAEEMVIQMRPSKLGG